MADRTPMTSAGYRLMQEELTKLKGAERQKAVRAIEEARAHGDLSENAEYDAAKHAQGLLEARIRMLELKFSTAQVVDVLTLSGSKVVFGATVVIADIDSGEEKTVTIVGDEETNIERGLISYASPLAKALIGKSESDTAKVRLPSGEKEYEILSVRFDYTG